MPAVVHIPRAAAVVEAAVEEGLEWGLAPALVSATHRHHHHHTLRAKARRAPRT